MRYGRCSASPTARRAKDRTSSSIYPRQVSRRPVRGLAAAGWDFAERVILSGGPGMVPEAFTATAREVRGLCTAWDVPCYLKQGPGRGGAVVHTPELDGRTHRDLGRR